MGAEAVPILDLRQMMTTIRDVATACSVSPMTVSLVLNNRGRVGAETRERVMQAVREMDYRPGAAEATSSRKPMNVLGVMTSTKGTSLTQPGYHNSVLNGLLAATDLYQQHVLLFSGSQLTIDPYASIRQYCDGRCDALVMLGSHDGSPLVQAIHHRGFPMVMIGASDQETISNVDLDNVAEATRLTEYLLELGHRRIAFISGPDIVKSARLRHQGYRRALAQWAIEADPTLEIMNVVWQKEGILQVRALLELPAGRRPTALFCWNDRTAIEAIQIAQSLKLDVPNDLSVIGIDDDPHSLECYPPLTTLRQPYNKIGRASVEILLEQVRGDVTEIHQLVYPGDIIVRKSTAAAALP